VSGTAADTVHNERTKLLANALDRASTTCFTVGIVTPGAGYLYNVSGFRSAVGLGIVAAVFLHLAARRALGGLRP
jgi:hypothetical protein